MIKSPESVIKDLYGSKDSFSLTEAIGLMKYHAHQYRWIKTTTGELIEFDDQDYEVLRYQGIFWSPDRNHVMVTWKSQSGKKTAAPVAKLMMGVEGKSIIHYKDKNPFNLRRDNIILIDHQTAHFKQQKQRSHNGNNPTSVYKGVSWNKFAKKWSASIKANYKKIHLGYFHQEIDAAREYNRAAIEYFGSEYSKLNVLPE